MRGLRGGYRLQNGSRRAGSEGRRHLEVRNEGVDETKKPA
jgi:hypothetical protein